ncbi:MAG TPA: tRNA (adenosine(37)-N6)-dimethylallyltransferase MiaA, partial [Casimicrobium huifangae]|nr:tRNA (adenosine(37)-N6)-dimethylallyltransferase MiaA [Casimicrobium huifangae]
RQLAKRQLTWLRSFPGVEVACDAPDALAKAQALLQSWLHHSGKAGQA